MVTQKWVLSFLMGISLLSIPGISWASDVNLQIDNRQVAFPDVQPYIDDQTYRTVVPIRFVSERLGATVSWDEASQMASLVSGNTTIRLQVGNSDATVYNGSDQSTKTVHLDMPPVLMNDRVLVPIRFVIETFGGQIKWIPSENTVLILKTIDPNSIPSTPLTAKEAVKAVMDKVGIKDDLDSTWNTVVSDSKEHIIYNSTLKNEYIIRQYFANAGGVHTENLFAVDSITGYIDDKYVIRQN